MTRADLTKRPQDVAAMFDAVARRYDVTNDVLSLGQDRWWRRTVTRTVAAGPGDLVLDLAAGTGTSSLALAGAGARVVACDFSLGMLGVGRSRLAVRAAGDALAGRVRFVAGDGTALPYAGGAFDAVTISFGLRNVVDVPRCLGELLRVTRPGGRLVVCEFSRPTRAPFRRVYSGYLARGLPAVAGRVSSDPAAYAYLGESILAWPAQAALADLIGAAGWSSVSWRNLSGGAVAVHRAVRPVG